MIDNTNHEIRNSATCDHNRKDDIYIWCSLNITMSGYWKRDVLKRGTDEKKLQERRLLTTVAQLFGFSS